MNKKWFYIPGLVIAALIVFYFYNRYHVPPTINFSRISLFDMDQRPVSFASFKGKKTIVSFSASWCPNCLNELRDISQVKESMLSDVQVLVISDEPFEKIMAFKEHTGYPFTFLKLGQSFGQAGINSIPTSYLLNGLHEVKEETVGYIDWKDPSTCEHMKKLMD